MPFLGDTDAQALRSVLGDSLDEGTKPARCRGALSQTRSQFPAATSGRLGDLVTFVNLFFGEASLGCVTTHDCLPFLIGQDVVDIVEAFGRTLFDRVDHALRSARPV